MKVLGDNKMVFSTKKELDCNSIAYSLMPWFTFVD